MYKLKLLHRSKRAISAQFIVAVIFLSLSNQLNAVETKVNILTLPVTVIDKKGEPVKGIPHNLFTVIVDKIPYEIEELREDKNLPVNLTIALNVSSSMKGKFSNVKKALKLFLSQEELKGEISLITFDSDTRVIQDWTENRSEVINKLGSLEISKENTTRLYDACLKSILRYKKPNVLTKNIVLVISDAGDFNSVTKIEELRRLCQKQNAVIHTLSIIEPEANSIATAPGAIQSYASTKQLEELSFLSGGTYFPIVSARELEPALTRLTSYIRNQYLIAIADPEKKFDDKRYHLEVKVSPPSGMNKLTVRSRDYYYAIK